MNTVKKYAGIFLNISVPLVITFLICFLGPKIISFFMPFVIGLIIALAAAPLVRFLERRVKLMRRFTSMAIIVGALALIVFLIWLVLSNLIREGIQFVQDAPAILDAMGEELRNTVEKLQQMMKLLPDNVQQSIFDGMDNMGNTVSESISSLYSPTVEIAGNVARRIPGILVSTIVTLMSAYFFLADYDKIIDAAKKTMPDIFMKTMTFIRKKSGEIVGSYFLAQFRIMFVIAAVLAVGLTIAGVSYSGLVAVLIAILDFLPIFGTGTVLIPWAVIKLLNGAYGAAVFLLALYGLTQLIRQLIQPKLIGDTMGMNPLLTLLFLYIGYRLGGFTGMILAVPIGMIMLEVIRMGAYDSLIDGVQALYHEAVHLMKEARYHKNEN
ncbi:MAG: sporulation integral membrane protein YtvI [Lachnospiraceae bacterium]|nr:sporulation integral membrane protein YtvI [Lachnospiraceae bacterium]